MKEIVCLKKVCICLYFIDYVLLMRDQRICQRNSHGNRETPTWRWRISCFQTTGRRTGRIFMRRIYITRKRFTH